MVSSVHKRKREVGKAGSAGTSNKREQRPLHSFAKSIFLLAQLSPSEFQPLFPQNHSGPAHLYPCLPHPPQAGLLFQTPLPTRHQPQLSRGWGPALRSLAPATTQSFLPPLLPCSEGDGEKCEGQVTRKRVGKMESINDV